MSDDLPEGWAMPTLEMLAASMPNAFTIGPFGSNLKVSDYKDAGVPLVFVRDIRAERFGGENTKYVSEAKARELSSHAVRPGDLLVTKMGEPPGDTAIYPLDRPVAIITADCIKLTAKESLTSTKFLRLCVRSPFVQDQIVDKTMGVAQQKLSLSRFKEVRVPLPPLPEQRRMVEKVEALLNQVDRAKGRLDRVPLILKRFRQAVLGAACSGKLTEEWRQGRAPDTSLDDSLAAAARFVQQQTLVRRRGAQLGAHQDEGASLPDGWKAVPLRRLGIVMSGQTPKDVDRHLRSRGAFPWLRVGDMNRRGNERLMTVAEGWLTSDVAESLRLNPLPEGAFIFPKRGGAIATNKKRVLSRASCVDLNTMAIVPFAPMAAYLWWWFASVDLGSLSDGSNVPQINHPDIEGLIVPVPAVAEQAEIVRRVEKLLTLADSLAARLNRAAMLRDRLPTAILSKAFSGELVATEAELARVEGREYETAAQLLERIAQAKPPRPRGGRATRKATPSSLSPSGKRRRSELFAEEAET